MKTAREYYTDTMEGVRVAVCGLAMLAVCGGRFVVSRLAPKRNAEKAKKPAPKEESGGSEIEDATVVGKPEG